ncbi:MULTISPECIES: XRE family transcriptional regulator [Burkholderia cepacia complex]|uniref:XRE family transcriptional regulator n=1 Tax=Burkholderia cepacia complex TaxID=87882 RepID=UPI0013E0877F|nr:MULTISPECIES: helix-turn-helix transcriptional regulator [Burkholderia cepacia complex]MCA8058098.1 helix-turn-helix transcriptional regulator [Burkholderia cepacia]MCW3583881.1 helix-turn-helix transcriptional regulator [Burkholderia cenocepacia]MCW3629300.1 helix-turn-helix transcriptional regulator [Burkholderia cenocepacia]MCW5181886.1 helix-turn-helix transcriptional regulator [Burkholderia cenocepacia]NGO94339.1 repressor [Burkholderia cenocepacia]
MNTKVDDSDVTQLSGSGEEHESGFHTRLRLILSRWQGSEASFARAAGVSQTGLNRIAQGGFPTLPVLVAIADTAGVSVEWLATGRGSEPALTTTQGGSTAATAVDTLGNPVDIADFVFIPRYNVKAAAGHGAALGDERPPLAMAFRRYWIDNFLGVAPSNLAVIAVKGDSMEGVLSDRDVILVNQADCRPGTGLYVLRMDGELFVKRVQRLPGGTLEVSSANEAYRPFTIDMSAPPSDFEVIGRVVWAGRQM